MSEHRLYIFDTSAFAKLNRDYPRENLSIVWEKVEEVVGEKRLISSEVVYREILKGNDYLSRWAKENRDIFHPLSKDIQNVTRSIINEYQSIIDFKRNKSGADPFVIAFAKVVNGIVVTEEKPSGGPDKVKIPDVCSLMKIQCVNFLTVLKFEKLNS